MEGKKQHGKKNKDKKYFNYKSKMQNLMYSKGVLATCNQNQEEKCERELYNLFNEVIDGSICLKFL